MFDYELLQKLPVLSLPGTNPESLTTLSGTQILFNQYYDYIETFYWAAFFATAIIVLWVAYLKIKHHPPLKATDRSPHHMNDRENKWFGLYKRLFSIDEIKGSTTLKLMGGAVLLGHLINYYFLVQTMNGTVQGVENGTNVCWPFLQGCEAFIFLQSFPTSHMQRIIYACLFFIIVYAAKALLENKIARAHGCIFILFIWHLYISLISYSQYMTVGAYTYYILALTFVFVFCMHRRFFFCLLFIFFYFLSVTTKLSDTWILGTYFSSEMAGAPLFSNTLVPFATNFVILIELFLPWFLISRHTKIQRATFYIFSLFHFYATFIVMYHYSIIAVPAYLILFGSRFTPFKTIPVDKKSWLGWSLIILLCVIQAVPHLISKDRWITLEGGLYGMYMIEANHQCDVRIHDGNDIVQHVQHVKPSYRCDPYQIVTVAQNTTCAKNPDKSYRIEFLHSVNGGPFYEIINEDNLCTLEYKAFTHNEWIKTREEAPALYRPAKN